MKFSLLSLFACLLIVSACKKDKDPDPVNPEYAITIMQPNVSLKNHGDTMHIHVNFDSGNQMTIHHARVRIENITDGFFVLEKPSPAHVHDEDGHWEFHFDLPLTGQWNVTPDCDLRLTASMWGEEAGEFEVSKSLQFHVSP